MNEGFYQVEKYGRKGWTCSPDNLEKIAEGVYVFKNKFFGMPHSVRCPIGRATMVIIDQKGDLFGEQTVIGFGIYESINSVESNNVFKFFLENGYYAYTYEDPLGITIGGIDYDIEIT